MSNHKTLLQTLLQTLVTGKNHCHKAYAKAVSHSLWKDVGYPDCGPDDSYNPVQCFQKECWCSYENGVEVPRTRVPIEIKANLLCDKYRGNFTKAWCRGKGNLVVQPFLRNVAHKFITNLQFLVG